jgi:hypothetical protein
VYLFLCSRGLQFLPWPRHLTTVALQALVALFHPALAISSSSLGQAGPSCPVSLSCFALLWRHLISQQLHLPLAPSTLSPTDPAATPLPSSPVVRYLGLPRCQMNKLWELTDFWGSQTCVPHGNHQENLSGPLLFIEKSPLCSDRDSKDTRRPQLEGSWGFRG